MMQHLRLALPAGLLVSLSLSGCASGPSYTCGVPTADGGCRSVSAVYADASSGQAPQVQPVDLSQANLAPVVAVPSLGEALLSRPRVVRVLVLPWEDSTGDLNAGGYIYLRLDKGEWTIGKQ